MNDEIIGEHPEGEILRKPKTAKTHPPAEVREVLQEGKIQRQPAPTPATEEKPEATMATAADDAATATAAHEAAEPLRVGEDETVAMEEYELEPFNDETADEAAPALADEPMSVPVAMDAPVLATPDADAAAMVTATDADEAGTLRHQQDNEYKDMTTRAVREIVKRCGSKNIAQLNAGVILLQEGYLSPEELSRYLKRMEAAGRMTLEEMLQHDNVLSEHDATEVYAKRIGMEFVDLDAVAVDPLSFRFVDGATATRFSVLPYATSLDAAGEKVTVHVALAEPENILLKNNLQTMIADEGNAEVVFTVAAPSVLRESVTRHYRDIYDLQASIEEVPEEEEDINLVREQMAAQDEPVVKLVNQIIAAGVAEGASDIHCETNERQGMEVRFRIDGILKHVNPIPRRMRPEVINRLKILSNMDIAEKNVPQDGRASLVLNDTPIDLRLVSAPTIYGENISIRILDKSNLQLQITELGFSEHNVVAFEHGFRRPHGSVLVTGPTGSGKTTTLYAALILLDKVKQNIVTIEDPVEYRIPGINQCQINEERNLDFTTALRGFMRADPDVIMVGEIRDPDTARISTEASLTGHLVLSTLHTNDAASAITRLMKMGVEAYALASTLECIVAQRLCRKLCTSCRTTHKPTADELRANNYPEEIIENHGQHKFFQANPDGCQHCSKTGYRGRTAISEVLTVSDTIKQMILEKRSAAEIKQQGMAEGMVPLIREGFNKVTAGITTVEEMRRVTI